MPYQPAAEQVQTPQVELHPSPVEVEQLLLQVSLNVANDGAWVTLEGTVTFPGNGYTKVIYAHICYMTYSMLM